MKPKLIAIDLDGTLLNSQGRVSARTAEALKAANDAGIAIAPATARWYQAAVRPFEALGLSVAAVASAGSDVRAASGAVLEQRPLDAEFAIFLAGLCDRAGWNATLSTPERAYRRANELPAWAANAPEWLKPVTTFEGTHLDSALSVLAEARRDDSHLLELDAWAGHASLFPAVSFNGDALLTITAPNVDKGSGLRALCASLGIDVNDAMAIGDSEVDIPMFRVAGTSIAMANGTGAAIGAAVHRTLSADDDGVAAYLESIL